MSADWLREVMAEIDKRSEDRSLPEKVRPEGEYDWQSNWVKVSDFIPERGSLVLFWNKRWDQVLAGFIGYRGDYRSLSGVDLTNPIPTHWMALPTEGPHQ